MQNITGVETGYIKK